MLPKLRLILAVMAAAWVVAALGFGLFSRNASMFAAGLHSARGAPLERSLPEPPDWKLFIALAAQRRAEELNRLLDLPHPEPLAAPGAALEPGAAGLPESAAASAPDGTIATPQIEPTRDPPETPEAPVAIVPPSEPPPAAQSPAAEIVASTSPADIAAGIDEPPPAEAAVSQQPEPPAVEVVPSVSPAPASEPRTVAAEVSVPSPAVEPAPAETVSSGHPKSEPPAVDVAMAVTQPPEPETVPSAAEFAPAEAAPAPAAPAQDSATLARLSTSAPEEPVDKATTAAVPLPQLAPPRTNVRHPRRAKAQPPARTKAARIARAARARAAHARTARTPPISAPAANPVSPGPFSGLYQQSHPSQ